MTMHAAKVETSERLQKVKRLLADGQWHSSFEIQTEAEVCSGSTTISELLKNGLRIEKRSVQGRRYKEYRLVEGLANGRSTGLKSVKAGSGPSTIQGDFFRTSYGRAVNK